MSSLTLIVAGVYRVASCVNTYQLCYFTNRATIHVCRYPSSLTACGTVYHYMSKLHNMFGNKEVWARPINMQSGTESNHSSVPSFLTEVDILERYDSS